MIQIFQKTLANSKAMSVCCQVYMYIKAGPKKRTLSKSITLHLTLHDKSINTAKGRETVPLIQHL